MTNNHNKIDLLTNALDVESNNDMIKTIVENVGNIKVEDINETKGQYEIFAKPSSFTGKELKDLQELFTFREIGIYGDPNLPEDTVYFHMILYVKQE